MKITQEDMKMELMKRLRAGENLLQAHVRVQAELLDLLRDASNEITELHKKGQLR